MPVTGAEAWMPEELLPPTVPTFGAEAWSPVAFRFPTVPVETGAVTGVRSFGSPVRIFAQPAVPRIQCIVRILTTVLVRDNMPPWWKFCRQPGAACMQSMQYA